MDIKDITKLIQVVSEQGLTSFELEQDNVKLKMKKEKERPVVAPVIPPAGIPAPAIPQVAEALNTASLHSMPETLAAGNPAVAAGAGGKVVVSPLVGTFYHSSSPEIDPFVKVGDTVQKGQVLGIVEAMKLMNEIESEFDGVVEEILVNNEQVVEYGQPLFRIR